jgi:hypothetical protein
VAAAVRSFRLKMKSQIFFVILAGPREQSTFGAKSLVTLCPRARSRQHHRVAEQEAAAGVDDSSAGDLAMSPRVHGAPPFPPCRSYPVCGSTPTLLLNAVPFSAPAWPPRAMMARVQRLAPAKHIPPGFQYFASGGPRKSSSPSIPRRHLPRGLSG